MVVMTALPGDRLVIRGHRVGEHVRDAEILEALGDAGGPPYVVRWSDDGRVSRIFPGSDAYVEHLEHRTTEGSAAGQTRDRGNGGGRR
jgi:uncharacterized protein DUF1918